MNYVDRLDRQLLRDYPELSVFISKKELEAEEELIKQIGTSMDDPLSGDEISIDIPDSLDDPL